MIPTTIVMANCNVISDCNLCEQCLPLSTSPSMWPSNSSLLSSLPSTPASSSFTYDEPQLLKKYVAVAVIVTSIASLIVGFLVGAFFTRRRMLGANALTTSNNSNNSTIRFYSSGGNNNNNHSNDVGGDYDGDADGRYYAKAYCDDSVGVTFCTVPSLANVDRKSENYYESSFPLPALSRKAAASHSSEATSLQQSSTSSTPMTSSTATTSSNTASKFTLIPSRYTIGKKDSHENFGLDIQRQQQQPQQDQHQITRTSTLISSSSPPATSTATAEAAAATSKYDDTTTATQQPPPTSPHDLFSTSFWTKSTELPPISFDITVAATTSTTAAADSSIAAAGSSLATADSSLAAATTATNLKPSTSIKKRDSFVQQVRNNKFINNSVKRVRSFLTPGDQEQL
ncbi:hypothetical protein HELRODRAFT_188171 [Helobdella robusta]|uniref:Uncharacterized protein n=1 Tax=Helobdella robusta TaxID=6412 RepID=T1FPQ4_HELRO|nr:hypothetical protein HELRODRAFT_188171 [Helobdella robusta]ESO13226.1 hypothetical protein HELRODRAFT_188171 [Helobdella robusta]